MEISEYKKNEIVSGKVIGYEIPGAATNCHKLILEEYVPINIDI